MPAYARARLAHGKRVQAFRFSHFSDSVAIPARRAQMPGIPMMSGRVTGIQLDPSTEFPIRGCPIPAEAIQDEYQRGMPSPWAVPPWRSSPHIASPLTARTCRLTRCTPVHNSGRWQRPGQNSLSPVSNHPGSLVPKITPLEIGLVGFRIHDVRVLQRHLYLRSHVDPDLLDNGTSHDVLKRQGIPQIPVLIAPPSSQRTVDATCGIFLCRAWSMYATTNVEP